MKWANMTSKQRAPAARDRALQPVVTVDALWDALRKRCCATKPWSDAKAIVQLRREDLAAAFKDLHSEQTKP